jgi:hypothetical protein
VQRALVCSLRREQQQHNAASRATGQLTKPWMCHITQPAGGARSLLTARCNLLLPPELASSWPTATSKLPSPTLPGCHLSSCCQQQLVPLVPLVLNWYNFVSAPAAGGVPLCGKQSLAIGSYLGRQCHSCCEQTRRRVTVPPLPSKLALLYNSHIYMGGGIVTRRHVRSQQEWHCLPRWEPTVKDRC